MGLIPRLLLQCGCSPNSNPLGDPCCFSSALAGLCSATGVGLVTLLRTSRSLRQTLLVLLLLWGIGAASGLLLGTLGI